MMRKFRREDATFLIAGIVDWFVPYLTEGAFAREFDVSLVKMIDIKPYREYRCQRILLYR